MVQGIHSSEIGRWWPAAALHLVPALSYGDDGTTLKEIREQLQDGRSMLWVGMVDGQHKMSAVLTHENKALFAWLIGGEGLDNWIDDLMSAMRRYAKECGLKHLKAITRPGLARRLRSHGWKTSAEIIKAEL